MNKKSIIGLIIALGIPITCYLILKVASENAVNMPRHYLLDTVVTKVVRGKEMDDSIWHKTANIKLRNQLGDSVSLYDKQGKILVLDFFFTNCRSICPRLTSNMASLQQSFKKGGNVRNRIDTCRTTPLRGRGMEDSPVRPNLSVPTHLDSDARSSGPEES